MCCFANLGRSLTKETNLVPFLQTPPTITLRRIERGRIDSFGYLSALDELKIVYSLAGGAWKSCRRRRLRGGPRLDSPCPDSLGNSVSL